LEWPKICPEQIAGPASRTELSMPSKSASRQIGYNIFFTSTVGFYKHTMDQKYTRIGAVQRVEVKIGRKIVLEMLMIGVQSISISDS
jgi:hypothetical protein